MPKKYIKKTFYNIIIIKNLKNSVYFQTYFFFMELLFGVFVGCLDITV